MEKPADQSSGATVRPVRVRVDWEAVERDFRTGKFTLRELETKHHVSYAQISRKSTKEGWQKDLRDVIRQATDVALLREVATEAQKDVTQTILIAAEANTQVILKHRKDIESTRKVAADLLDEVSRAAMLDEEQELLAQILAGSGADPKDEAQARALVRKALDFGNRVGAVKALAETFVKLQASERIAFKLDEPEESESGKTKAMTDTERAVRLANLLAKTRNE